MAFISYAQNREDVLINRAFGGQGTGFYIDIGAFDPVCDSVTKALYDRGWCGLNVEPGVMFETLASARPRDINLRLAVLDRKGEALFLQDDRALGLSRIVPNDCANEAAIITPCDTLEGIIQEHVGSRPIDLLKIDAEGSEETIIISTDWEKVRPRIVLVESTVPMSNVLINQKWEQILIDSGYTRVYFDGINMFYVRNEEKDFLAPHFLLPVNALDNFVVFDPPVQKEIKHWQSAAESALAERDAIWAELSSSNKQLAEVTKALDEAVRQYEVMRHDFGLASAANSSALQAERAQATRERKELLEERLRSEEALAAERALGAREREALLLERHRLDDALLEERAQAATQQEKILLALRNAEETLQAERTRTHQSWVDLDQARAAAAVCANELWYELRDRMAEFNAQRQSERSAIRRASELEVDRHDLTRLICALSEHEAERTRAAADPRTKRLARRQPRTAGHLDFVNAGRAFGWAYRDVDGGAPCIVEALLDGVVIGETTASIFREDLREAGIGDGRHGFELSLVHHSILQERPKPAELRIVVRYDTTYFPLAVLHLPEGSLGTTLFVPREPWLDELPNPMPLRPGPPYDSDKIAEFDRIQMNEDVTSRASYQRFQSPSEESTTQNEDVSRIATQLTPDAVRVLAGLEYR